MASVRDIKRKIKSVNNIAQITRAMKMVAASRIKKVETINRSSKPYAYKIKQMAFELVNATSDIINPLMEYRTPKKVLDIIISADKGLCGAYNSGIIKFAQKELEKQKEEKEVIILGLKAQKYFAKKNLNIIADFINWTPSYTFAKQLARMLTEKFINKEIDEVNCYYVKNITSLNQQPVSEKMLPLKTGDKSAAAAAQTVDYIFEPGIKKTLSFLLKKYMEVVVYTILIEAKVSELNSRLRAMSSATDNADKLSGELKLQYFRARQEAITNELLEVVSGVEALSK